MIPPNDTDVEFFIIKTVEEDDYSIPPPQDDPPDGLDDIKTHIYTQQHPKRKNAICAVHKKGQVSKSFFDIDKLARYIFKPTRR